MQIELKRKILRGITFGGWMTIPSPEIAELMGGIGFDWLIIDVEMGAISSESLLRVLQAVGNNHTMPIVSVLQNDPAVIGQALSFGAQGIIAPMVCSKDDAQRLAEACRYAPIGNRLVCFGRGTNWEQGFSDYVSKANESVLVVAKVEHERGIRNIEEIVMCEGIDAIMVGFEDLAASLGLVGQSNHPKVVDATEHILRVGRDVKKPVGCFVVDTETVAQRIKQGFQMIGVVMDVLTVSMTCRQLLHQARLTADSLEESNNGMV